MESFRDLVESMENDLKDDGKPRRFRPKVEKDEENNSPVSGLSGNRVQHESAMEDGGRRKVKIELRADLERARWEKEEEEGRAVGGSEARREKKREMFMRGQDTAPPWLEEKQSGSVYDQQELPPPERLLDQQDTPPERVKSKAKDPQLKRHSRGRARTSGYKSTFSTPGPGDPAAPDPMPAPPGDEWPSVSPSRGPRPSKGISGAVAEDIGAGAAFSLGGEHPETLFR